MFEINIKLLENYFLVSDSHNLFYHSNNLDILTIDLNNINKAMKHLSSIIDKNKQNSGLYNIVSTDELMAYLIEYIFHLFSTYKNKFKTKDEFKLFIYVNLALFLTSFSANSLNMIKYLSEFLIIDSTIINYLEACVESNDTRGLFFYLCKKYNLSYDKLIEQNYINYEYNPPTINKQWQKKYKKDGNPIVFWFYESLLGKSLFLVLYGPKCRYKIEKGGCSGCNLPSVSSPNSEINDLDIKRQIDSTFNNNLSDLEKLSIKELILSNNGSILDNKTISKEALQYSVEHAITNLTNLKKIILETRIDHYTNFEQLSELYLKVKNLNQNISIELAIGFEIFDDELRNGYYKKGLEKSILEMKLSELSTIDISLKIYMMYKAVPDKYMDVDAAICDINNGSKYFSDLASKYNSSLNIHISPTYLATGTQLYKDYKDGLYTPLTTQDIKKLYDQLNIYDNISYYISMNDEGLTDDRLLNGSDYSEYIELSKKIHEFNITQYR